MAQWHSQWHSLDLTDFDLAPAARAAQKISESVAQRAVDTVKDATYIAVGFGLLALKRAQVQRRAFEQSLRE